MASNRGSVPVVAALIEQMREEINTLFGNTSVAYSGSHEAHHKAHALLTSLEEQLERLEAEAESGSVSAKMLLDAEGRLEALEKFARDVMAFACDPRPPTIHDFEAIRAAGKEVLASFGNTS